MELVSASTLKGRTSLGRNDSGPSTTNRACRATASSRNAASTISGPMPAGSPAVSASSGDVNGDVAFPIPAESGSATTVVAFVQNTQTGDVLQALALTLAPDTCAAPR
jgi:hypothetical protein